MKKQSSTAAFLFAVLVLGTMGCQSSNPVRFSAERPVYSPAQSARITPQAFSSPLIDLNQTEDLAGLIDQSSGLVLVDFYADWCGPCQKQSLILNDVVSQPENQNTKFVKVNIDQHPDLASQFQVSGLPTLVLFKNGSIVTRQTGVSDQNQIAALLSN